MDSPPAQTPPTPKQGVSPGVVFGLCIFGVIGFAALMKKLSSDPEPEYIRELGSALEDEGAIVLTDVKGSARPPILNGHIPDVYAITSDLCEISVEVENGQSVDRSHARKQDAAFRKWASEGPNRHYEQHVVEKGRGRRS